MMNITLEIVFVVFSFSNELWHVHCQGSEDIHYNIYVRKMIISRPPALNSPAVVFISRASFHIINTLVYVH